MSRGRTPPVRRFQPAPTVTVVVCSRNCLPFLKRALRGVRDQTFDDLEIVLADDSTDGTRDWLRRRRSARLRCLPPGAAAGPGPARNRALAKARGEFIALLDADDLWHPSYLETMLRGFQRPEVLVTVSDFRRVDARGRRLGSSGLRPDMPVDSALPAVIGLPFLPRPSASIFRRTVFERLGAFDETLRFALEDFDLFLRIGLEFGPRAFRFVNLPLVDKRVHAGQKTAMTGPCWQIKKFFLERARRGRFTRWQKDYLLDWIYFADKHRRVVELIDPGGRAFGEGRERAASLA